MIAFDKFPDGKKKAATMSFDDGYREDKKLIEIFDRYGIRGTFHINSGLLYRDIRVDDHEVSDIYKNHEVSAHGYTHANFTDLSAQGIKEEIEKDCRKLSELSGQKIRGMSYPNGKASWDAAQVAKNCGIEYARTTVSTERFTLPDDFMFWNPTCHHLKAEALTERFINSADSGSLLYIWGHSVEFESANNWWLIERICKTLSACNDIWFATNIEIYDYVTASRKILISDDCKTIENPTNLDVWFTNGDKTMCIKAGETLAL